MCGIITWTPIHDTVDGSKEDTPAFVVKDDDNTGLFRKSNWNSEFEVDIS